MKKWLHNIKRKFDSEDKSQYDYVLDTTNLSSDKVTEKIVETLSSKKSL